VRGPGWQCDITLRPGRESDGVVTEGVKDDISAKTSIWMEIVAKNLKIRTENQNESYR
jgi:hypothetical protein